jgi:hypothetical protein
MSAEPGSRSNDFGVKENPAFFNGRILKFYAGNIRGFIRPWNKHKDSDGDARPPRLCFPPGLPRFPKPQKRYLFALW